MVTVKGSGQRVGQRRQVRVLTHNIWGTPVGCQDLEERMRLMAEFLSSNVDYDVVFLQEVWRKRDFIAIRDEAKRAYPFSKYFYSGQLGSGLCILSKHPFVRTAFKQFSLNGFWHELWHGDHHGGKGVGHCRILIEGKSIDCYLTHFHANYAHGTVDSHWAHRAAQSYEMAQFINLSSSDADVVICAGDFNIEPHEMHFRLLTEVADLIDAWDEVNPGVHIGTCDTGHNPYTPKKELLDTVEGKRIDHVVYRSKCCVSVAEINVLDGRIEGRGDEIRLSDHQAIDVAFDIDFDSVICSPAKKHIGDSMSRSLPLLAEFQSVLCERRDKVKTDKRRWGGLAAIGAVLFALGPVFWVISVPIFAMLLFCFAQYWFVKRTEYSHLHELISQVEHHIAHVEANVPDKP